MILIALYILIFTKYPYHRNHGLYWSSFRFLPLYHILSYLSSPNSNGIFTSLFLLRRQESKGAGQSAPLASFSHWINQDGVKPFTTVFTFIDNLGVSWASNSKGAKTKDVLNLDYLWFGFLVKETVSSSNIISTKKMLQLPQESRGRILILVVRKEEAKGETWPQGPLDRAMNTTGRQDASIHILSPAFGSHWILSSIRRGRL